MRINRRWLLGATLSLLPVLVLANTKDDDRESTIRWDIVHIASFNPVTVEARGPASAFAQDMSAITLTGSGTFVVGDLEDVTGGGTWQTFAPGAQTPDASGRYKVTGLIRFDVALGVQTSTVIDHIGDLRDERAGLAFLRLAYSDGSRGILAVSCHLNGNPPPQGPDATPASVFEGIRVSKGFVDYWNGVAPQGGIDANRTLFHVLREKEN